MAHKKFFRSLWKKISNSKLGKNEYSQPLSSLDLIVNFENSRFVDVCFNIFGLVRPMFLFFYWRKLQGLTHLLNNLIMGVWRTENVLEALEKRQQNVNFQNLLSNPRNSMLANTHFCSFLSWEIFSKDSKNFLYAIHPWSKYFRGAFDLVVYADKRIRNIGRTNPKIFNKMVRVEKEGVFFSLFPT